MPAAPRAGEQRRPGALGEDRDGRTGYESTFAINHLGPFLLTTRLLRRLVESAPARIVNVASNAHMQARRGMPFDDLQSTRAYAGMRVYGTSKLANILFTNELAPARLAGQGVTANSFHPGTVATGYGGDGDAKGFLAIGLKVAKPFFLSPQKGARTSIYLASSPDVAGVTGEYFVKCKPKKPGKQALDVEGGRRLWEVSEELIAAAASGGLSRRAGAGHRGGPFHRAAHGRRADRSGPPGGGDGPRCEFAE